MYICTFPRMRPFKIMSGLAAAFLLSLPLTAQDARTHSAGAPANLRIDVYVVRSIGHHHHEKDKDRDRDEHSVAYDLMPRDQELSITREVRPMLVEVQGNGAQKQLVSLTTVVAR